MNRKQIGLIVFAFLAVSTVIGAYAGTIGVNDLFGFTNGYGFTDLNSTFINAGTEFYRDGVNYTQFILNLAGAANPFDQDLNTTDAVTFATINVDQYNLSGVNITDLMNFPNLPASYTMFYEGGVYYIKNGTSGLILDSGPAEATLKTNLRTNMTGEPAYIADISQSIGTIIEAENLENNHTVGKYVWGQAGEALSYGDLVFLESDGDYMKSDSNSTTTMYCVAMAAEKISNTGWGFFLIDGYARCDSWPELVVGSESPVLVDWDAGDITQTLPDSSGDQVQRVGYPIASKIIRFHPDDTIVEIA